MDLMAPVSPARAARFDLVPSGPLLVVQSRGTRQHSIQATPKYNCPSFTRCPTTHRAPNKVTAAPPNAHRMKILLMLFLVGPSATLGVVSTRAVHRATNLHSRSSQSAPTSSLASGPMQPPVRNICKRPWLSMGSRHKQCTTNCGQVPTVRIGANYS